MPGVVQVPMPGAMLDRLVLRIRAPTVAMGRRVQDAEWLTPRLAPSFRLDNR